MSSGCWCHWLAQLALKDLVSEPGGGLTANPPPHLQGISAGQPLLEAEWVQSLIFACLTGAN